MSNYSILETSEGKYIKEVRNNIPNGKETFYWKSGHEYIEDWKNNIKEGRGFSNMKQVIFI